MSWPGKAECAKTIQRQSVATLLPVEEESVNWDTTQNVIIEGDNLEVLKVLQKAYLGKVKMIYIDPPYNTGNDFIYPDNYTESLKTYLQYTGQVDDEGRKFSTNTESSGRFHSKWMNMMYPRLSIARDFLKEDGVVFVSIGSEEVSNLRFMLDEIYGQENFEGMVTWRRRTNQPNDRNKLIGTVSEYILVYAKNSRILKISGVGKVGLTGNFSNSDNDPRGPWATKPWTRKYHCGGSAERSGICQFSAIYNALLARFWGRLNGDGADRHRAGCNLRRQRPVHQAMRPRGEGREREDGQQREGSGHVPLHGCRM
jgi:adenine-specific DNA-methyltransferase